MKTRCPNCNQEHDVDESQVGMEAQCFCGKDFLIQQLPEKTEAQVSAPQPVKSKKGKKQNPAPAYDMTIGQKPQKLQGPPAQSVVITDVNIPFWKLVTLLVNVSLAAIPAMIILGIIYAAVLFVIALIGGVLISR